MKLNGPNTMTAHIQLNPSCGREQDWFENIASITPVLSYYNDSDGGCFGYQHIDGDMTAMVLATTDNGEEPIICRTYSYGNVVGEIYLLDRSLMTRLMGLNVLTGNINCNTTSGVVISGWLPTTQGTAPSITRMTWAV